MLDSLGGIHEEITLSAGWFTPEGFMKIKIMRCDSLCLPIAIQKAGSR